MSVRAVVLAMLLVAACADDDDGCPGSDVHDPGAVVRSITAEDIRILPWSYSRDDPDLRIITTTAFRLDGDVLVIDDGLALQLADTFTISCNNATDRDALAGTRFGASFTIDVDTLEVVSAGCGGCA